MHQRIIFVVTAILLFTFGTSHAHLYDPDLDDEPDFFVIDEPVKDSIVKIHTDSIEPLPDFSNNYEIPYIGKKLMIGGVEYGASNIIRINNDTRKSIMQAMRIKWISRSKFQLDLREIKKVVHSLKNKGNLFSAINLKFKKNSYKTEYTTIDLLTFSDEYYTFEKNNLQSIEFVIKSDLRKVRFETLVKKTRINSSFLVSLELVRNEDEYHLNQKFKSWTLAVPGISAENTRSLPYVPYVVDGEQLEVSITPNGVKTNVTDYSLTIDSDVIDSLQKVSIPIFGKLQFSKAGKPIDLKEIFEMMNLYNIYMQLAFDYGIELDKGGNEGKLYLTKIKDAFNHFPKKKFPTGSIAVLNESLTYTFNKYDDSQFYDILRTNDFSKIKTAKLHNQSNTLVYKITIDSLHFIKNTDKVLQKESDFNASLDAYFLLDFNIFEGFIIVNFCFISRVDLTITSDVKELNILPYQVQMGDKNSRNQGKLRYSISIDMDSKSGKVYNPSMTIDFDDISLKIRNLTSVPLHGENHINRFVYDFKRNKWKLPEILKTHKLTPDELLKKTYAIVNSLRGLHEQVKNSPEEFPAGSAEKIANFTEKFEQVVYGDGTVNCNYGLLKTRMKKGQKRLERQKNFTSLSDTSRASSERSFLNRYKQSWKTVFKIERDIDDPCKAIYLDSKKKEINWQEQPQKRVAYVKLIFNFGTNIEPMFKNALNEQLSKFSEDAQVLVDKDGNTSIEFLIDLTH